jgi:hypothetical protein
LAGVKRALVSLVDYSARLAFFAVAPLLIVRLAAIFPVTGALLTIGAALVVFLFAEAFRGLAARFPVVNTLLRGQLAFEAYYRVHPPRPFVFYAASPLLLPYWLWMREARRELWLYKGYTVFGVACLAGVATSQYFEAWRPDLGVGDFAWVLALQLVVETLLVFALVMPITTTIVHFHGLRARKRLGALLLVALASSAAAVFQIESRRDPVVSYSTRERLRLRTKVGGKAARAAQHAALAAAWQELSHDTDDVDRDGKVMGEALDAAHRALRAYYKEDEAFAFDLWQGHVGKSPVLVVYFEARRGRAPIFLAEGRGRKEISDPRALPKGALAAMKHAADGIY